MRVVWSYHGSEPSGGAVGPGSLPAHSHLTRGSQSLYLVQRVDQEAPRPEETARVWELRNRQVQLPSPGDTLYWCRVFRMPDIKNKHHLIRVSTIMNTGIFINFSFHTFIYTRISKYMLIKL